MKILTSKMLVMQALDMLAVSIYPVPPDRFGLSAAKTVPLNLLAIQQREIMQLSQSTGRIRAILLANVVCRLAIERKTKTLLITGQHSMTALAVNLLLYRANIDLEKIANPNWYQSEMKRLSIAAGELARAPLFVVGQMLTPAYSDVVSSIVINNGTRCLVVENPPPKSIWNWQQLSCEFGVPITIISSNSVL